MPFKIRTKLIVAFMSLISAILILTGLIGYYNISASDRAVHKVEAIAEEIIVTGDLHRSLEHVLMPANDYLITGDRKYIDDFNVSSKRVEEAFKKTDELLGHLEAFGFLQVKEERKSLKDVETAWQNIRELSLKILSIPDPIGNKDGAMMMEEMDYRWGDPATELIHKWQKGDVEEYKEAVELAEKARRMSWIIMGSAGTLLLILGAGFAVFYSGFFVRPIKKLHNGADAIAGGDFESRVDVKTGDELEQLSNAMNEMAEKLDDFYGSLENRVEERTRELNSMLDTSKAVLRSHSFTDRARCIFDNAKEVIGASAGYVALVSEDGTRNEVIFLDPGGRECTVDPSLPMPIRGLRERAYRTEKAVYDNDFSNSEWMKFMPAGHVVLDNVLFAPLFAEGKALGLLGLANKPGGFNDNDARLLSAFGDIATIALLESTAFDALKESEERYRGIFERTPNAMVIFDAETRRFENVNRGAIDLYGYTEEEFLSMTPADVSAEVEKTRQSIQNGLSAKCAHIPVRYHKKKDGTVFPIEIYMGTFLSNGRLKGFAVIVDLTENKKNEEILLESKERYRVLGATAPNAIICLKAPDTITFWNRRAEEIFGYSEEEAVGRTMHDLIVPERYREKAREGQKSFFQTGTGPVVGKTTELFALRRDGTEFPIELSISSMNIGGNWQATGIVQDITERKKAEAESKKYIDELERFQKITIKREFRIKELNDEVKALKLRLELLEKK